jgi:hypothetical protein
LHGEIRGRVRKKKIDLNFTKFQQAVKTGTNGLCINKLYEKVTYQSAKILEQYCDIVNGEVITLCRATPFGRSIFWLLFRGASCTEVILNHSEFAQLAKMR